MNQEQRQEKLTLYGRAHAILQDALSRFPRGMWRFKPSDKDWSIHEIVVHITDSEANSYIRARRLIAEPGQPLMAYDENAWAAELDYQDLDTEAAVELFKWLRGNTYAMLQTIPEGTWSHSAYHPENGETTLEDWLDTYARHVPEHVEQMERVLQAWLKSDPSGR
jgi:hypothetical protein